MTMYQDGDLEDKIQIIGRELHAALSGTPPAFDTRQWTGRIMAWAIQNEDFKMRLFRFIDVLPSLRTDDLVVRLLHEYFSGETEVPAIISGGIGIIPEAGALSRAAGRMIRNSVEAMARQFIAGKDADDAVPSLKVLTSDGTGFSLDILGEVVVSEKEAREYAGKYLALLEMLREQSPGRARPDVSVKVSSFYSQLDPVDWEGSIERAGEGLRPVLRKAKEAGISVTFDMEHYHYKGLIIELFRSIFDDGEFADFPTPGLALQAYLKDTEKDLSELIRWARKRKKKINVRLVKGAYWDYELAINRQKGWPVPVFLAKEETDRNFERLTRLLFENSDVVRPAIATHNLRSICHAIAAAGLMKVPSAAFEFQMLYGMAEPLRKAVRERGFDIRIYTPVGELIPGMAYLVRRLLENTSNESFLRKSFGVRAPLEELIKAPSPSSPIDSFEGRGEGGRFRETPVSPFTNEPPLDFSVVSNRKGMRDALDASREMKDRRYPLLIGGRQVWTGREIVSQNPAHPESVVGRVSSASRSEADAAIEEALKVRDAWRKTGPEKRADYLFKAAKEMRKKRVDLAALEVLEVGKTWKDADGDVCEAIDYLEYYGREMLRLGVPRILGDFAGEENEYYYGPKGICVVISPWNFPLAIAAGMTSAALVAGNCVIFKPSGLSPVTGYRLCEIFRVAGLPPGVLQFLPGPGSEVGEYLVSHKDIDVIAFTGSREVGLRIVKIASEIVAGQRNVKKVVAEMGGKNAVIVDGTADLDEAVKGIIESAFGFQGQKCSACSRLIVTADIIDELTGRLVEAVQSMRIGPPEEPGSVMGPLIDEAALKKIQSYIELGKQEGRAVLEVHAPAEGYFAGPSLFADIASRTRVAQEEIFGPVLAIMRAKDIGEAVALANESQYALTGGLFSRSPANIERIKEDFRAGNLYINRKITGALVGRQPFGGFGMSGIGSKAGGPDYLLQFMNPVSVSENTIRKGFAPMREEGRE
jgi:RHH-type proline utilization regulon transcriptional repressor/proline dehydrogenase/delta 1-pyrroline-5-carboxylate dehydrogenase